MPARTIVDLHSHSSRSDGVLSPTELVKKAAKANLSVLSLTDHDTTAGIEEASIACAQEGIKFITGIEISAYFSGGTMHILGYFIDPFNKKLIDKLSDMLAQRSKRNEQIVKKLNEIGVPVSYDKLKNDHQGKVIGRPHIAHEIIKLGKANDFHDAFSKYLGENGAAYYPKDVFLPHEVFGFIHDAGGLSFIAHPVTLRADDDQMEKLLPQYKNQGLSGLEAWNYSQGKDYSKKVVKWSEKYDFMLSGGSDFHGIQGADNQLGHHASGELITPDKISSVFTSDER